jgi:hypothetical protein
MGGGCRDVTDGCVARPSGFCGVSGRCNGGGGMMSEPRRMEVDTWFQMGREREAR